MATRPAGATLPLLRVTGTHSEIGEAMGRFQAPYLQAVIEASLAAMRKGRLARRRLHEEIAPYVERAERVYPAYTAELRAMAQAADVPFDLLFRLNCYESRPPGARQRGAWPMVPAKDPGTMAAAGRPRNVRWAPRYDLRPSQERAASAPDGCTSVASRGRRGIVIGHTEDSYAGAAEGLYLLDATIAEGPQRANGRAHRFLALNYAQTLPGCAAAVNDRGLVVLIDALPDPERALGVPRHFVSRAMLDMPDIDAAIEHLRVTVRGGGWNYVMVQGRRLVNVETTATKVVISELGAAATHAHTNHYVSSELATSSGEPRPNSLTRLIRALDLVRPNMDRTQMKGLLSDRQGFPDSICRERTIGAFVADTAAREIEVCWGEPDQGTWTSYRW